MCKYTVNESYRILNIISGVEEEVQIQSIAQTCSDTLVTYSPCQKEGGPQKQVKLPEFNAFVEMAEQTRIENNRATILKDEQQFFINNKDLILTDVESKGNCGLLAFIGSLYFILGDKSSNQADGGNCARMILADYVEAAGTELRTYLTKNFSLTDPMLSHKEILKSSEIRKDMVHLSTTELWALSRHVRVNMKIYASNSPYVGESSSGGGPTIHEYTHEGALATVSIYQLSKHYMIVSDSRDIIIKGT